MATRSKIAIELEDGTFKSIYCHWDGYPSGVGKMLQEHYTDREKINSLLELGDISSLEKDLDSTVAYHRDRGESYSPPAINSRIEYVHTESYLYLFRLDGEWRIFN